MRVRCHLLMFTRLPDRTDMNFSHRSFWGAWLDTFAKMRQIGRDYI